MLTHAAVTASQLQNMPLAETLITKALQIAPNHNMARYHLANLYYYR